MKTFFNEEIPNILSGIKYLNDGLYHRVTVSSLGKGLGEFFCHKDQVVHAEVDGLNIADPLLVAKIIVGWELATFACIRTIPKLPFAVPAFEISVDHLIMDALKDLDEEGKDGAITVKQTVPLCLPRQIKEMYAMVESYLDDVYLYELVDLRVIQSVGPRIARNQDTEVEVFNKIAQLKDTAFSQFILYQSGADILSVESPNTFLFFAQKMLLDRRPYALVLANKGGIPGIFRNLLMRVVMEFS